MIATRTWIFWNYSATILSKVTRLGTDGPWGHMGIGFDMSAERLHTATKGYYYEALRKEGFVGPIPAWRLHNFIDRDPKRKLVIAYTDLSPRDSEQVRMDAVQMKHTAGYFDAQLFMMALSERYGIPVPRSKNKVVCSEAVSRLLAPRGIDLRDRRRDRHDEVNPNSAWRRFLEIIAGYNKINAPAVA